MGKFLLTERTASQLKSLLNQGPEIETPFPSRGGVTTWNPVFVRCLSATAVGGSAVGDQCYSAEVVKINSLVDDQAVGALVWLTALNEVDSATVPVVDKVYHGLYAGRFDASGDNRLRVFATVGATGAAGGAITVEEQDGSPSVASVATLRFDQADGFVVSTPGAGIARVDLAIPAFGIGPTAANFEPVADNTWEDTGVTKTLPSAGTYLIWLETVSTIKVSGGTLSLARMWAQIKDLTAGVEIPTTGIPYLFANSVQVINVDAFRSAFKMFVYVASGANQLGVQVQRPSGPTWVASRCDGVIGYLKIG